MPNAAMDDLALDRFLNDLVTGRRTHADDVDTGLAETARELRSLAHAIPDAGARGRMDRSVMAAIHQALIQDPDRRIEVIASPDAVCGACPHRQSSGCTLNGQRSEKVMVEQDQVVLQRLGLKAGDRLRWVDLLERIRNSIGGDELPAICGSCRWLPLGYCREGINRLGVRFKMREP